MSPMTDPPTVREAAEAVCNADSPTARDEAILGLKRALAAETGADAPPLDADDRAVLRAWSGSDRWADPDREAE